MRLLALLIALASTAFAAEPPTRGIDVSLISEQRAVAAGKPFTVALKIHHHPKFHTYWQNPGIVGVPVKIDWQLPPGFTAGATQWPYPEPVMMKIHPAFGYERDVLLLTDITPPAQWAEATITLRAKASWMACAEGCYPGEQTLELTLPVAPTAQTDPALTATFAAARAELPKALEHWTTTLESKADAKEVRLRLKPADDQALDPGAIRIFSCDGQLSSDPAPRIEKQADGSFLIIAPRAEYSPSHKTSLPCVIIGEKNFWPGGPRWVAIEPAFTK